jgi:hypothetical protein
VSLELIKIASERVRMRKLRMKQLSALRATEAENMRNKSISRKMWTKLSSMLRRKRSVVSKTIAKVTQNYITDEGGSFVATYLRNNKERILRRFRNSFVNLALPMVAFTQPVEAEELLLNDATYNLWDELHVSLENSLSTQMENKIFIYNIRFHLMEVVLLSKN